MNRPTVVYEITVPKDVFRASPMLPSGLSRVDARLTYIMEAAETYERTEDDGAVSISVRPKFGERRRFKKLMALLDRFEPGVKVRRW